MNTKIRVISLILSAIFVLSLVSCGKKDDDFLKKNYHTPAGAFRVSLSYEGKHDKKFTPEELKKAADSAANVFVNCYTLMTEGETLMRINAECDAVLDCDSEFLGILSECVTLSQSLGGKPELFGGAYTGELKNETHTDDTLAEALTHVGADKITVDGGNVKKTDSKAKIDLCAVAAGYSSDKAISYLKEQGIKSGSISVGKTVTVFGAKPDGGAFNIKIGENDTDEQYLSITDGAVSTVDEKNFVCDYGAPGGMKKVTVYAADAFTAQALSHVLYSLTGDEAMELYKNRKITFEAVMTDEDGKTVTTEKLDDALYTSQPKVTEDE